MHARRPILFAASLLWLGGCGEVAFAPLAPSDRAFSVFGALDASADTQAVRVTPLRPALTGSAAPLDAVVTLRRLDTGAETVWRDSVVAFGGGRVGHVYWSAERVAAGAPYRLTVARADGAASTATVTTPNPIRRVEIFPGERGLRLFTVEIEGAERLADLRLEVDLANSPDRIRVNYLARARRRDDGVFVAGGDVYADVCAATDGRCPELRAARVRVAAATEAWPDFLSLDTEATADPDAPYVNVEGGLGFVGAIATAVAEWPGSAARSAIP